MAYEPLVAFLIITIAGACASFTRPSHAVGLERRARPERKGGMPVRVYRPVLPDGPSTVIPMFESDNARVDLPDGTVVKITDLTLTPYHDNVCDILTIEAAFDRDVSEWINDDDVINRELVNRFDEIIRNKILAIGVAPELMSDRPDSEASALALLEDRNKYCWAVKKQPLGDAILRAWRNRNAMHALQVGLEHNIPSLATEALVNAVRAAHETDDNVDMSWSSFDRWTDSD